MNESISLVKDYYYTAFVKIKAHSKVEANQRLLEALADNDVVCESLEVGQGIDIH